MEDEEFERLEKIQFLVKEGYDVPKEDLDWVIQTIRRLDTMTNLMASKLTAPVYDKTLVLKYYKEEANKRLCMK